MPAQLANTIGEFVSPDAPGGPSRQLVPAVAAPQLPNVAEPQTGLERGVRLGSTIAADLGSTLLLPVVRRAVIRRFFPGSYRPRMFEPGTVAQDLVERQRLKHPQLHFEPGSPAARGTGGLLRTPPTPTLAEVPDLLKTPPSEGARNLARLVFDFHADDIPTMGLERATAARRRILHLVPDHDLAQEAGPLKELLDRMEGQILWHR